MKIPLLKLRHLLHNHLLSVSDHHIFGRKLFFSYDNKNVIVKLHENQQIRYIAYEENGKRHLPHNQGPDYVSWYSNGQICLITFSENGKFHRPRQLGPAFIKWNSNEQLEYAKFYENDQELLPVLTNKTPSL